MAKTVMTETVILETEHYRLSRRGDEFCLYRGIHKMFYGSLIYNNPPTGPLNEITEETPEETVRAIIGDEFGISV